MTILEKVAGKLIVSCQALPEEALHGAEHMACMAEAVKRGGAAGIRANSVIDIQKIKEQVDLPVIGIIKQDYEDSEIYITPTLKEVKALLTSGAEMIAMDATLRKRPKGEKLEEIVKYVKEVNPDMFLMADCATVAEAKHAEKIGFDVVSTTLVGYTEETKNITEFSIHQVKNIIDSCTIPVIAEGRIHTPEQMRACFEAGAFSVVVGGAITRPTEITKRFIQALH